MKISRVIVLFTLLIMQSYVLADNSAQKEAEKLLGTIGMDIALERSIEQMLNLQLQQNPAVVPFKAVILKFFNKHMSFESLKPDMIKIYADAFTTSELRELNAFYRTPAGVKTIQLMPELMAKGAQIGVNRVKDNMHELQQMIKDEAERIKNAT